MKEWFKARNIWGAAIMALSDAEAGRLAKALWTYTMTGEQQNLSGAEKGIFAMIQMTLSQDDERDSDISAKRAASGSLGGKQKKANEANAYFANNGEAKQAFATNKNQNKNKNKKDIDDDDDDDDDNYAREGEPEDLTEELERREAIGAAIEAQYGRKATPAEGSQISLRAKLLGQTPEMAALAIKVAAENGARNVIKYVTRIFDTWDFEHVKTPEEAEELARMRSEATGGLYALDSHEDAERMREARERRKAEHKEG